MILDLNHLFQHPIGQSEDTMKFSFGLKSPFSQKLSVLITYTILLNLFLVNCHSNNHEEKNSLTAAYPWKQDVTIEKNYVAQVKAIQRIEIRAFEKGYLTNIYMDEGKVVKKGQKLFQVMPMLVNAQYEKAKAEYESTSIEYENTEKLFKENVVSQTELSLIKARLKKNKATMDLAQIHLNLATVTAPFTGITDRFQVRLGSLVEEGTLLTTISDISKLWVYFNVSEKDYLNFTSDRKSGDKPLKVKFLMANNQLFKYEGIADTIEGEFDSETGTIPFRATFPNPDRLLRHGETGNVVVHEKLKDALIIPQKATFEVLDKHYVYIVNLKGKIKATEIKIANEIPHLFVVESGISENDIILLEGLGKVHDDDVIKYKVESRENIIKSFDLAAH
ncbi:efflux RND transporter periplasmic adaptor subunit [Leptospira sp. 2 VSF19]|uniref:Efflux RND transporter periplasmic adaptor subunit n=1 Tax=Leptospira soteropolitanensis TaxID=2950025 RepID=A0AAW5VKB2_9LEPT|nr:efflux RND transporter periplasmic adaptor subunit [Leptospira soteropolitanensis]MCW7491469.1 efflux RND transporter periplasmic adaptor subunit [Leptospira soteropolitanensis]MCW7499053.1 efflux RND transporter periplasmic adaptor subunit [Leptospira soteropolitanensis]MCW7521355.1 efflux RND transporter periplasmic adaptor subunit [Leptospira soteropolitanensis]MCW7525157.1 efflux RND transporter periplasmic adaptor subunit [Leptospira soteropolitanensis]MCW7529024.1 efflux RND transport